MKIDLHNHFCHEFKPGKTNIREIVDTCIERGLDVIGIVDFNQEGYRDNRYNFLLNGINNLPQDYKILFNGNYSIAIKRNDKVVYIIRTQEVHTLGGHILVVGAKRDIKPEISLEETIKQSKNCEGIVIADHPYIFFGMGQENLEKYVDDIDLIEGFNSYATKKSNDLSKGFAQDKRKPYIASSDAHSKREVGRTYTIIPDPKSEIGNEEELKNHIRISLLKGNFDTIEKRRKNISILEYILKEIATQIKSKIKK